MKLAHRLVQIPRQLRYRLSAHRLSRDGRHYPTHLLIREAFLRGISTRRARPLRPAAENVSAPPAESSSPGCARCAAESYRSGSRNRARSSRCGKLGADHAAVRSVLLRKNDPAAAPTSARKTAARLPGLSLQIAPQALFTSPPENVGNAP
jgi:hypothetical protein